MTLLAIMYFTLTRALTNWLADQMNLVDVQLRAIFIERTTNLIFLFGIIFFGVLILIICKAILKNIDHTRKVRREREQHEIRVDELKKRDSKKELEAIVITTPASMFEVAEKPLKATNYPVYVEFSPPEDTTLKWFSGIFLSYTAFCVVAYLLYVANGLVQDIGSHFALVLGVIVLHAVVLCGEGFLWKILLKPYLQSRAYREELLNGVMQESNQVG